MNRPSLLHACIALGVALSAWIGVFFFAQSIHERQATTGEMIARAKDASTSQDSRNQMLAVFASTATGRQRIGDLLHIDFLTLADKVVAAGADAGVVLRVSNVTPENTPVQARGAPAALSAMQFTVESDGSFPKLLNAVAFLESLPIPSQVEDVSFYQTDNNPTAPWSMKVGLRILTALPISS